MSETHPLFCYQSQGAGLAACRLDQQQTISELTEYDSIRYYFVL